MCNEGEHGLWLADWFQFSHGNILQVRIASRVVLCSATRSICQLMLASVETSEQGRC